MNYDPSFEESYCHQELRPGFQVKRGQKKIFAFLIVVQERCGLRCEDSDPGSNSHYFKILMELWNILMELRTNCGY